MSEAHIWSFCCNALFSCTLF